MATAKAKAKAKPKAKAKANARAKVSAKPKANARGSAPSSWAGVGDAAVEKATGRAWEAWLALLDSANAKLLPHKEIVALLFGKHGVPGWWAQMVAVGYEQARGLRAVGQKSGTGDFAANASKTIAASVDDVFAAWEDARRRARWLPGAKLEIRRATSAKSMRITWLADGSSVDVGFYTKGPAKSAVALDHSKLASAAARTRQKRYWSEALERLKALTEA